MYNNRIIRRYTPLFLVLMMIVSFCSPLLQDRVNAQELEDVEEMLEELREELEEEEEEIVIEPEILVSNDKISITEIREIKVTVTFPEEVDLDKLKWSFGGKDFDRWKKWDIEREDFVGESWIEFSEEPELVEDNVVEATIKFDLPFDTDDLAPRNIRTKYRQLIGTYDLEVKTSNTSLKMPLIVNTYDDYHLYEDIKPAIDELLELAGEKNDRYFEHIVIGKSTEGRDMNTVVVAKSKAAMDNYLNNIKPMAHENPEELIKKVENGEVDYQLPIYINNTHPDESAALDGQYVALKRLATEDEIVFNESEDKEVTLKVDELLDDVILVFNVTINPDGLYHNTRQFVSGLDPNRDLGYQTQIETRNFTSDIVKWNPITLVDIHGFVKSFLIEPCTPPHEPNYEYDLLMGGPRNPATNDVDGKAGALEHARAMGEAGIANSKYESYEIPIFDRGYGWDDATLAYVGSYGIIHGAMTHTVEVPDLNQESANLAAYVVLASANYVSQNKDDLFKNQLMINHRSLNNIDDRAVDTWHTYEDGKQYGRPRGENENFFPEYYIIPVEKGLQKNILQAHKIVDFLIRNGVKVEKAKEEFQFEGVTYPEGSFIVPLRQVKRGFANAALYDGVDESAWGGLYTDLITNLPMLTGFDRVIVREKGLFDEKTEYVKEVTIPTTSVKKEEYIIKNINNDATKAVNKLLRDGKEVSIITETGSDYKKGDFLVARADFMNIKDDFYLEAMSTNENINGERLILPKIHLPDNSYETKIVLEGLGFQIVDERSANVIVDTTGRADIDDIKAGKAFIGIGGQTAKFVEENGLIEGLEVKYEKGHEGLMRAIYSQDHEITSASYDGEEDFMYIGNGSFITKAPETSEVLGRISDSDDFYISGWWPKHGEANGPKGHIFALKDLSDEKNITLFTGEITDKGRLQHLFRLLSNSIYTSLVQEPEIIDDSL